MDKKKGLSAFLNKNKKKDKGKDAAADASPEKGDDKVEVVAAEVSKMQLDDKGPEEKKTTKVAKKKTEEESSSEDDDDMRIGTYGKVLEKEENTAAQDDEEKSKAPTDFADLDKEANPKTDKAKKEKKTATGISFGSGRPTFGNRAKVSTITKDDGGLEDLLDDEVPKGKKAQKAEKASAQIVRNPVVAEEAKGPVRPTFKGKLKLNAGADTAESGSVQHAYDFGSKYKSDKPTDEEEKEHGKKQKKPQSFNIGGGKGFAAAEQAIKQEASEFDDDGFEIVGAGQDRKARRQKAAQYQHDHPDDGFKIVRNTGGEKKGGAFDAMK